MPKRTTLLTLGMLTAAAVAGGAADEWFEISAESLRDKIRGGLTGQILGNLNGLPHEMKYIAGPGNVAEYTPSLPDGARTDDDTDLEWVYATGMVRAGELFLPPGEIAALWKRHINRSIWCSNLYVRQMMDLGFEPPLTGSPAVNPWAEFNISGQFLCESFGLMAPAMPETAARLGVHYTRVGISGEPAQTTQLFAAMIAEAFAAEDVEAVLDAGLRAVDPDSVLHEIAADVRRWHAEHPNDWRAARRLVHDQYSRHGGAMRDKNGYELNTASTLAALLYGGGDFAETLRTAFNFGWDADNNAATAGAVIGAMRGRAWMERQGWEIKDVYRNTTRDHMPDDETLSGFADKLCRLAELAIRENGGETFERDGEPWHRIKTQEPAAVYPLLSNEDEFARFAEAWKPRMEETLTGAAEKTALARAAYLAICLGEGARMREAHPEKWTAALDALRSFEGMMKAIRESPTPDAERLRARAREAGLLE